jgi:ElaB/YqjD/DUF883 family membrane-anchored ribosome-binding protein
MVPEHRQEPDEPAAARAEIEQTRARMSDTLDEIEDVLLKKKDDLIKKKEEIRASLDVGARIREKPLQSAGVVIALGFVVGFLTGGDKKAKKKRLQAEDRANLWQGRARRLLEIAREQEVDIEELEEQLTDYAEIEEDGGSVSYLGPAGDSGYRIDPDELDDETGPDLFYDDDLEEDDDEEEEEEYEEEYEEEEDDLDEDEIEDDSVVKWIDGLRRRWSGGGSEDYPDEDEEEDQDESDEGPGVGTRLTELKNQASDRAGELLAEAGLRLLRALQRRL